MKHLKKTVFSILMLAGLLIFSNSLLAQNFTGTWTRNTEKTDPGNMSINSVPIGLNISQTGKNISIQRTSKNKQNDTTRYTEELKFDGSVALSIIPKSNFHKKSTLKWSDDQKSFTETADYTDDQGNTVQKVKETWTLTNGGKGLHVSVVFEFNGATYYLDEVFDKQ